MTSCSVLDALATLIEIFEEAGLVLVLDFLMVREAFVTCIGSWTNWADLVKENASPDVSILHVVEALVALGHELVNAPRVAHLVVLAPVAGELELGLLGRAVLAEAAQVHHEGHVAAVATEQTHALQVGLNVRSATYYINQDRYG